MPLEPWRCTRRDVLKAAGLALGGVFAGCDKELDGPPTPGALVMIGSLHIVGYGMYEAFNRLRISLNKKDREVLEEFIGREDLLIHIFLAVGRLPPDKSRGGASAPRCDRFIKQVCDFHPIAGRFAPERNWDVVYDPGRAKEFEEKYRIPNPPEVVLYHEIFGHVIPGLSGSELMCTVEQDELFKKTKECEALDIESRYREQTGRLEVPRKLMKCPSP